MHLWRRHKNAHISCPLRPPTCTSNACPSACTTNTCGGNKRRHESASGHVPQDLASSWPCAGDMPHSTTHRLRPNHARSYNQAPLKHQMDNALDCNLARIAYSNTCQRTAPQTPVWAPHLGAGVADLGVQRLHVGGAERRGHGLAHRLPALACGAREQRVVPARRGKLRQRQAHSVAAHQDNTQSASDVHGKCMVRGKPYSRKVARKAAFSSIRNTARVQPLACLTHACE